MRTTLTRGGIALCLLASSPALACGNDMAGGSALPDLVMISLMAVAGGALTLVVLLGFIGIPTLLVLKQRREDEAIQRAAGISSDGDGPPDVWVPGS